MLSPSAFAFFCSPDGNGIGAWAVYPKLVVGHGEVYLTQDGSIGSCVWPTLGPDWRKGFPEGFPFFAKAFLKDAAFLNCLLVLPQVRQAVSSKTCEGEDIAVR